MTSCADKKHLYSCQHLQVKKQSLLLSTFAGKNIIVEAVGRKSPPPHGFKIVKGSAYGSFSRAFVEFILQDQRVKDLIEWSKDIESPDEYVFPTVHFTHVMNVPGGYRGTFLHSFRFCFFFF